MNGEEATSRRLQAQLKFLNYYQGAIDGVFGALPQSLENTSQTRLAIYNFKQARNLLSDDIQDNFQLSNDDIIILNQEAEITEI